MHLKRPISLVRWIHKHRLMPNRYVAIATKITARRLALIRAKVSKPTLEELETLAQFFSTSKERVTEEIALAARHRHVVRNGLAPAVRFEKSELCQALRQAAYGVPRSPPLPPT